MPPPDLLISRDAGQFGVRVETNLFVSGRSNTFDADVWARRYGLQPAQGINKNDGANAGITCDGLGCIAEIKGETVALVFALDALAENCVRADIVLSAEPVRGRCPSAHVVIDRFSVWREGAHALWLENGQIRVDTSAQYRGLRPWVDTRNRGRR